MLPRNHFALMAAVTVAAFFPSSTAFAQFPGIGNDTTSSLGQFRIAVNPAFQNQAFMTGYPAYSTSTKRLTSPTLFDPSTVIGRSDPTTEPDASALPVGSPPSMISDSTITLYPAGWEGVTGQREVHTEVRSLNMTGSGAFVKAGTTQGKALSPGEVQSQSASGVAANDFPANSFFDIFVDVNLPTLAGGVDGLVNNGTIPLLVQNNGISSFPPKVVYIHGNSSAVPVAFAATNGAFWQAGDILGWLVLAGHGISYTNSGADLASFQNTMSSLTEMPLPQPLAVSAYRNSSGEIILTYPTTPPTFINLHGTFVSDPVVTEDPSGNVFVFALDASGSLWGNFYNITTKTATGWTRAGGVFQGNLGAGFDSSCPCARVAGRSSFNDYWVANFSPPGTFDGFVPYGGSFATSPVVTSRNGNTFVVGKDSSNTPWASLSGSVTHQPFVNLGGQLQGQLSAVVGTDGRLYLFGIDQSGSVWQDNWVPFGASQWGLQGGVMTTPPTASQVGNFLSFVATSSGGTVWKNKISLGTGQTALGWTNLGGAFKDIATATGATPQVFVFGRDSSNTGWTNDGATWSSYGVQAAGPFSAANP